jgi:hypothetical protein
MMCYEDSSLVTMDHLCAGVLGGVEGIWGIFVTSSQICCEPETILEK